MHVVEQALGKIDWKNKKLLVACSGGLDSVVLVHALKNLKIPFAVLHVNYQLRGIESDSDQEFVEELSEKLSVPCYAVRCPKEITIGTGINLQNSARDFRRQLFDQWKSLGETYFVGLAHHIDDQIETFFLQFYRGSGMIGLSGMKVENDRIIRPFLSLCKEDLRNYALEKNISWREDSSNSSTKYLRNLFRNKLIPELKKSNSGLEQSILELQSVFSETLVYEEESMKECVDSVLSEQHILDESWKTLSESQKTILLRRLKLPHWSLERIEQLFHSSLSAHVEVGDFDIYRTVNSLTFSYKNQSKKNWEYKIEEVDQFPETFDNSVLYCNSAIINGELIVRNATAKDKIAIRGMEGRKSVWDLLKEAGIPAQLRANQLVISLESEIIWVPGIAVSKHVLVKNTHSSIVKITLIEKFEQSAQ